MGWGVPAVAADAVETAEHAAINKMTAARLDHWFWPKAA
jgi:hypothetical protein